VETANLLTTPSDYQVGLVVVVQIIKKSAAAQTTERYIF
jgi:hypothetical protein